MTDRNEKLGIVVEATDLASGKLSNVKREVAGIKAEAGAAGGRWSSFVGGVQSGAGKMKTAIGGAVSHAKSQFMGLANAGTALLGIGGIFGIGAILTKSIQEAADFGRNVQLVARSTGLAVPVASAMVDTLDKWGVSSERLIPMLGKMEKNLGAIVEKKDGLKKFKEQFGVALTDSSGKLMNANQLLLKSADYFNSHATATQKALFLSKLWGKNWQDMIPILSKGSAFIKAQENDAIHLTQAQLDNITKFQSARREFQDSWGDLEVKIGANIMPLLTKGMSAVSSWVDSHGDEIATWFGSAADTVGKAVGGIIDVFGAIRTGWESVPGPLRDLVLKGFAADRAIKFTFGFDPIKAALGGAGGLLGNLLGKTPLGGLFQRGSSPANPMWVQSATGGPGGLSGSPGGGLPLLGMGGLILAGVAAAEVGIAEWLRQQLHPTTSGDLGQHYTSSEAADYHSGRKSVEDIMADRAAITAGFAGANAREDRTNFELQAANAQLVNIHQAIKSSIGKLDDRLKHPLLPHSKVNAQLHAALRIAKSSESTDQKIRDLEAINPDLVAGGHKTNHYVQSLIAVEKARKTSVNVVVNLDDIYRISGGAGGPHIVRTSTTGHAAVTYAGAGKARGGTIDPNVLTMVGEEGPELQYRGVVYNARRTERMLDRAYGGGPENALGHVGNANALEHLAAAIERMSARPVYAYASARDVVAQQHRRGSSRPRQIGW